MENIITLANPTVARLIMKFAIDHARNFDTPLTRHFKQDFNFCEQRAATEEEIAFYEQEFHNFVENIRLDREHWHQVMKSMAS